MTAPTLRAPQSGARGRLALRCIDVLARLEAGQTHTVIRGRSGSRSYLFEENGREYYLKLMRGRAATPERYESLVGIDAALDGFAPWYLPLEDIALVDRDGPQMLTIRPHRAGAHYDFRWDQALQVLWAVATMQQLTRPGAGDGSCDFATPWTDDFGATLRDTLATVPRSCAATRAALIRHTPGLTEAARRLTIATAPRLAHGDLHGLNLLFEGEALCAILDWEEAGFSRRPIDAAKTMWLLCRESRESFRLNATRTERYYRHLGSTALVQHGEIRSIHALGAIYFLPTRAHVLQLQTCSPEFVGWYFDWIERFWSAYDDNEGALLRLLDQGLHEERARA